MKKIIFVYLICQFNLANLILPQHNSNINYTHVLFEWRQLEDAYNYQLQIAEDLAFSNILTDTISQSLIYVEKNNIDWNSDYHWRVRSIDSSNNLSPWSDSFSFTTSQKRSNAEATILDELNIQDGITIFSSFFDYFTAIIDKNGNEVWNSEDSNLVYYTSDYYGNLFGTKFDNNDSNLPGIEFSINNDIIWSETGDSYVHHDFFKLPNGNYLGIIESHQSGPIPENIDSSILFQFQIIGYPTYPSSDLFIFPWVGDEIVEWDSEGNIVWSWNTFDYLNWLQDYDLLGDLWLEAYQMGRHDWTHSNALWYSEAEDAIYLSSRHLSRIIKIDRNSKEIVWQMGLDMPSGEVNCGHNLNYSFQHSIQILDNGNIVILDNGNNSQDIYGTEFPTTRALEIQVTDNLNGCEAEIIWQYTLPEDLFGFASGNVQKLDNGNYLITTVGGGATSLEIMPTSQNSGEIVWQGNYNLAIPSGAVYRAHRLSGLYPIAFSVTANNFKRNDDNSIIYPISENTSDIGFKIWNDGEISETFNYSINNSFSGSIEIDAGDFYNLVYPISNENQIALMVTPENRQDLSKTLSLTTIIDQSLDNELFPSSFILQDPYPNPFNPKININFNLLNFSYIELNVIDMNGNLVKSLENNYISQGSHNYNWDASNMSSGNYLIELKVDNVSEIKKITLVK